MDPQGPTKTEQPAPVLFPALHQRRASAGFPYNYSPHSSPFPHQSIVYYALTSCSPFYAMTGPIRSNATAGSSRQHQEYHVQPPRPPNAWILYRSDQLKLLPPSKERRAQADVSKLISNMWKNEQESVKLHYERLADAKKAEHQRMYPTYRFQPMKKEDKERMREAKRLEKEKARADKKPKGRSATSATPTVPAGPPVAYATPYVLPIGYPVQMQMPHPHLLTPYHHEARFGPAGPSPPLSAASSPNGTSTSPEPQSNMQENTVPSTEASTQPSPDPESQASSSSSQPLPANMLSLPQQYLPAPQQASPNTSVTQSLPTLPPASGQWQQPPQLPMHGLPPHMTPEWNDMTSVQLPPVGAQNSEELLNFDIPFNQSQTFAEFQQGVPDDGLQGLLSMTGANGVFSLSNISPSDILANPQGQLEIAMGPPPNTLDFNGDPFADFDFSAWESRSESSHLADAAVAPTSVPDDFTLLFQTPNNPEISTYTTVPQRQPSLFTQDVMQFLNLEAADGTAAPQDVTAVPPAAFTTVAPQQVRPLHPAHAQPTPIFTQMTNTPMVGYPAGYVPPAGAANSSSRRVAGSWKPSLPIPESPVEEATQLQPWAA
ncbi:hypothetical protein F5I97DRAFT_1924817 [Phlebopus sp. FC_14]|nr:hypothetical protein F5I97DRAFT_1924817 [Phlebopus sp. FC_14]